MANVLQSLFVDLARYQIWANERLFVSAAKVSEADWHVDREAFFGSLHHTLDHVLLGTRVWRARLEGRHCAPANFREQVTVSRAELRQALQKEFEDFSGWLDKQKLDWFTEVCRYTGSSGQSLENPVTELLYHVFNHATHHRGQASTLLSQFGAPTPEMDYIYYLRAKMGN